MAKKKMASKSMPMKEESCSSCKTCGMHVCAKCAMGLLVFGLLFILTGLNIYVGWADWINGWTLIGAYLFIWGALLYMKKNM